MVINVVPPSGSVALIIVKLCKSPFGAICRANGASAGGALSRTTRRVGRDLSFERRFCRWEHHCIEPRGIKHGFQRPTHVCIVLDNYHQGLSRRHRFTFTRVLRAGSGTRHAGILCPAVRTGNGTLGKFVALEGNGSEPPAQVAGMVIRTPAVYRLMVGNSSRPAICTRSASDFACTSP